VREIDLRKDRKHTSDIGVRTLGTSLGNRVKYITTQTHRQLIVASERDRDQQPPYIETFLLTRLQPIKYCTDRLNGVEIMSGASLAESAIDRATVDVIGRHTSNGTEDDCCEIQVVSVESPGAVQPTPLTENRSEEEVNKHRREQRRKRRRKLRRMVQRSEGYPSFFTLLTANYDVSDVEEDDNDNHVIFVKNTQQQQADSIASTSIPLSFVKTEEEAEYQQPAPKRVRIDVDAALGLKNSAVIKTEFHDSSSSFRSSSMAAADEGWYEGTVRLALPEEDALYLPGLQVWARRNLELFSATLADSGGGGRRFIRVGRVGLRCVHCAAAHQRACSAGGSSAGRFETTTSTTSDNDMDRIEQQQLPQDAPGTDAIPLPDVPMSSSSVSRGATPSSASRGATSSPHRLAWSLGAVSYPTNVAALHALCSQKPVLHFEKHCVNLPEQERNDLRRLLHEEAPTRGRRSKTGGVSLAVYYVICAKRIGLVDVANDGVRFGRDLSLEPLPFETIKRQVEQETLLAAASNHAADITGSAWHQQQPTGVRIAADEESELVLAQAVAENDDPNKFLCTSRDKSLVTDYMFLTLRQIAICNATLLDLGSRGKKTKLMRVGFAGFCCRHCSATTQLPSDYTCRSFASAADNLVSAISNSFAMHLQKCYKTPYRIKKAVTAYKRIHQRQMAQLPYGSQRKLVLELWNRLRNADKTEEEMEEMLKNMPTLCATPIPIDMVHVRALFLRG
jgi:hypothetical protein